MQMMMKRWLLILVAVVSLSGCGYNQFQALDEASKSAWSEVLNQYQRRADLVPNIVATVKGEASFEQDTLTKVIEARAKATSIQVTPETLNNPEAFNKFQQAQGELSSALSRLMVVSERYPDLKANQAFKRPARDARGHREPHHRGAQPLHRERAGVQRARAQLPDQPHRQDLQLRAEAQLLGAERGADFGAADSRLQRSQEVSRARWPLLPHCSVAHWPRSSS
jgi:hypothetical protein